MSPSSSLASVAGQWTVLRAGSRDPGGLEIPSMPLSTGTAAGPIRLAVGPTGEPRLLLPLVAEERPVRIDAGSALAVTVSSFTQRGRAYRFLDITCLSAELETVFGEVVDEIVARVSKGIDSIAAARTTLDDFRSLLAQTPSDRIERGRVAGLVAELVVLNRLLDLSVLAWRSWRGPAGDRHDFRSGDTSLEVKASMRTGPGTITVNGLHQFEPPSGGTLHLAHFTLEPVSGGLLTVSGLGRRAFALADDPSGLRDLLVCIGCPDVDADPWNRDSFRIEAEGIYRIEADFPCIVPSAFAGGNAPAGVSELTYRIDLSVASAHKCLVGEFDRLLQLLLP